MTKDELTMLKRALLALMDTEQYDLVKAILRENLDDLDVPTKQK